MPIHRWSTGHIWSYIRNRWISNRVQNLSEKDVRVRVRVQKSVLRNVRVQKHIRNRRDSCVFEVAGSRTHDISEIVVKYIIPTVALYTGLSGFSNAYTPGLGVPWGRN